MFQCPPPKSTAASPKQLPANGRRRRAYSARSYATGGAWGGGQAHIAARRAQDIPDVYAGEASRLLDGQLEDLHSRLKEPGIVAAMTRQGLRLSELIGLAKEVSGPEGRDGRPLAGHLLGQVLWDAGVATDGAPPEAGGAGPKRPNSAGLATRRQCSAGFSDDTGWSDPRSTRQHMRKPTEIIGHGSPETWREQKWRTMSAREYRVDRCAYEAQTVQDAMSSRDSAVAEARSFRSQRLDDTTKRASMTNWHKAVQGQTFQEAERYCQQVYVSNVTAREQRQSQAQANQREREVRQFQEVLATQAAERAAVAQAGSSSHDAAQQEFERSTGDRAKWQQACAQVGRHRALSATSATPRQLRSTGDFVRWQADRMQRIRQNRRHCDLERRGCAPDDQAAMW